MGCVANGGINMNTHMSVVQTAVCGFNDIQLRVLRVDVYDGMIPPEGNMHLGKLSFG